jgi:hypothetical protein
VHGLARVFFHVRARNAKPLELPFGRPPGFIAFTGQKLRDAVRRERLIVLRRFNANAAFPACSTAWRFSTGKQPGNPKTTGSVLAFGSSPNADEDALNNFDAVFN